MKAVLRKLIRYISPSIVSSVKMRLADSAQMLRKARFWKWNNSLLDLNIGGSCIKYFGTEHSKDWTTDALSRRFGEPPLSKVNITVSELPLWNSLCIPRYVNLDVPLAISIEQLLSDYGEKLRRVVVQQLPLAEIVAAQSDADIAMASSTMLEPYAVARHGPKAAQVPFETVSKLARPPYGCLHILNIDGEAVGCHLGVHSIQAGKKYWSAVRFGYIAKVFANPKRLHEVNSTNVFLATKYAKEIGANYYSLGMTLAQPDDGLLHWKRRRGGELNAHLCVDWVYVRPPRGDVPVFFWGKPLFSAAASKRLSLHVGIPAALDEKQVLDRYRDMHFRGLQGILIHADRSVCPTHIVALERQLLESDLQVPIVRRSY